MILYDTVSIILSFNGLLLVEILSTCLIQPIGHTYAAGEKVTTKKFWNWTLFFCSNWHNRLQTRDISHFLLDFYDAYPSNGRQNVLASASNKSPHLPQCPEFPIFSFCLSSNSFFCCSTETSGTTKRQDCHRILKETISTLTFFEIL